MTSKQSSTPAPARMEPVGLPSQDIRSAQQSEQPPSAGVAFRLLQTLRDEADGWIYLTTSERRAEETARALASFLPRRTVLHLPAWDCLPYDRAPASREIMGKRLRTLRECLEAEIAPILVLSAEAAVQKLPPTGIVRETVFSLATGEKLDREALERFAHQTGYAVDDRVDEPGEIAFYGNVVDIFPADAEDPVRITDIDGVIQAIMRYDPRTQRTSDELESLNLGPASEVIKALEDRQPGQEHRLSEHYEDLASVFDYLPKAKMVFAGPVSERLTRVLEQITEAHASADQFGDMHPVSVTGLYLDEKGWKAQTGKREPLEADLSDLAPMQAFSAERFSGRALAKYIREHESEPVVLCGSEAERKRLLAILKRSALEATEMPDTLAELGAEPGLWLAGMDLDAGFVDTQSGLSVIAATDVLGSRLHVEQVDLQTLIAPLELRVGDVVVHEEHGVGILRDLAQVKTGDVEEDTIQLEYQGETKVMVPVTDFGKLWRYGAEADAVTLDRLNTDAWDKKRASVSLEIEEAAQHLAELAKQRLAATAEPLKPPKKDFDLLAQRFPYVETADQTAAIKAVLDDLASGHPMNRLICGDVGFGKTEIALRAAAAAALAGRQVAMIAPTTVLVRQHLESFERRFAGTDIKVGTLSRLNSAAEATATRDALRNGNIRIVVATHAIAGKDVELPELGLVIIDEEQRFGAKLKRQLQDMAANVHLLSMTATPIPRSLQAAMVGLQDVSILATPPARRRPIRTFVAPFDAATARTALLREMRRGGQSFVVVPRIEDIEHVQAELTRIVPDLEVTVAHGGLKPQEIDEALMGFANGRGHVLLATNIIESGLDVPRANTMLVWRADRFGLSQLHQLRGRVGRGRSQGVAYLFLDPEQEVAENTRARLSTLEAFDRLGSGFQISARDLELRGAGDLLGEDQAGHVHLIGSALYQQLLERALAQAKNEKAENIRPAELNIGSLGSIPPDYVPEAVVRINLYARLQRITKSDDLDAFAEELEDRFGPLPEATEQLIAVSRLAIAAGTIGIDRIDAGPLGIALTAARDFDPVQIAKNLASESKIKERRIIVERKADLTATAQLSQLLRT
ncbi:DEAD/DEAH box helicase [Devosia rhizoryzae]|uniref:Transcription-repair-coupling factor n=1 Tax=Devosia rhizoryzae TaxID=2774137 RepID=A0ABX7C1E9_9HYPH|nr:DEAD/DEAH box helicase [Devosia rhizoryzae]QQR38059.1 DEAD/DEAH box helicase [Devosia rhizoryzae]